jgi:hypothetical protein
VSSRFLLSRLILSKLLFRCLLSPGRYCLPANKAMLNLAALSARSNGWTESPNVDSYLSNTTNLPRQNIGSASSFICCSLHWGLQITPVPVNVEFLDSKCLQPTKINRKTRTVEIFIVHLCTAKRKIALATPNLVACDTTQSITAIRRQRQSSERHVHLQLENPEMNPAWRLVPAQRRCHTDDPGVHGSARRPASQETSLRLDRRV